MASVCPQSSPSRTDVAPPPVDEAAPGESTLWHVSLYSAASYLSQGLFLIRGFLLARILGPAAFGLWSQMKISLIFLPFSKIGTRAAMLREIPFTAGSGDAVRADRIRGAVFAFDLIATGLVGSGLLVACWLVPGWSGELRWLWSLLAVTFVASEMYWFAQLRLRAEKRFKQVGRMMVGFALLSTVMGLLAAQRFGLQGFLVAYALAALVVLLPVLGGPCAFPRPRWDGSILREMLGIGFPIMAAGALLLLLWNVDKLAVWILMSRESLGIYALGSYLLVPLMLIPEAVSVVLYPRLMERFGRTARKADLERYLTRPTLILSYLGCPVLGVLFLSIHLPVQWLLPRYVPAIVPARILIAALFFMIIARLPNILLISLNRQKTLLLLTTLSIVVATAVAVLAILSGHGLIGAATGAAAGFGTYSILLTTAALRAVGAPAGRALRFVGLTVMPCLVVSAVTVLALAAIRPPGDASLWDLVLTGIGCLAILFVGGLLVVAADRHLGLLRRGTTVMAK